MNKNILKVCDILFILLFLIIAAICLFGFIQCTKAFTSSLQSYEIAFTDASTAVATAALEKSNADELLRHLEQLQTLQKASLTNDLMSFIYGVLSTILVGLCAGFVNKSRANSREAQDAADQAAKYEEKAKEAVASTNKAKDEIDAIREGVEETQNNINEIFKNTQGELNRIGEISNKQIKLQKMMGDLLSIHI